MDNNKKKSVLIIFSGYNQRAIITLCRVCNKHNIPFFIVSSNNDSIDNTIYKNNIIYRRKDNDINIELFINIGEKIEEYNNLILIPSSEYLNRFLLENRAALSRLRYYVPLVDKNIYENISDKYKFGVICKNYGLNTPLNLKKNEITKFPVVIKSRNYLNSKNKIISPIIAADKVQLNNALEKYEHNDYYIQEFIDGESYYILLYFSKDNNIVAYSQQNLLQQDEGKSILMAVGAKIHNSEISKNYEKLLREMNYYGLIMIELRKKNNEYYMIEANPRLWGPSQLFVDADVPILEFFLRDLGFDINIKNNKIKSNVYYCWCGGIKEMERKKRKTVILSKKNENKLLEDHRLFFENDIYKRKDTLELYIHELKDGE